MKRGGDSASSRKKPLWFFFFSPGVELPERRDDVGPALWAGPVRQKPGEAALCVLDVRAGERDAAATLGGEIRGADYARLFFVSFLLVRFSSPAAAGGLLFVAPAAAAAAPRDPPCRWRGYCKRREALEEPPVARAEPRLLLLLLLLWSLLLRRAR